MNVLIIGAAGYVGNILRPSLERYHTCRYLDLAPIPGAEDGSLVGDINDEELLERAVKGVDAVVFLAMGRRPGTVTQCELTTGSFEVNVCGYYRTLMAASRAGVRRFVLASSLSAYRTLQQGPFPLDELVPADALEEPYGFTKRLAEFIDGAFAQRFPDAGFVALRLMWPRSDKDWPGNEYRPGLTWYPIGPEDLRNLFLAALDFKGVGAHVVQATGDLGNEAFPNLRAMELLGWKPVGK